MIKGTVDGASADWTMDWDVTAAGGEARSPVGAEGSVEKEIKKAAVPISFRNSRIDFPGDSFRNLGLTFPAYRTSRGLKLASVVMWSRVLLEKLIVAEVLLEVPRRLWNPQRFIIVFTRAHHWSLS
jgi:hypothetical protein